MVVDDLVGVLCFLKALGDELNKSRMRNPNTRGWKRSWLCLYCRGSHLLSWREGQKAPPKAERDKEWETNQNMEC